MSDLLAEVLAANAAYADGFGARGGLAAPPARRLAILTCMDARLNPAAFAGLVEGDAHVIRNAGGRASDDAIRSLLISHHVLGTTTWLVIHHTECGMQGTDAALDAQVAAPAGQPNPGIVWLTFSDLGQSVRDDVTRLRAHPLTPPAITIRGLIYDVRSGRLHAVPTA